MINVEDTTLNKGVHFFKLHVDQMQRAREHAGLMYSAALHLS